MFIISLSYKKELDEVEKYIDEHITFLNRFYESKHIIFSGRKNPRTGGIILVYNITREGVASMIKEDPFYIHDIADFEITEVNPTKYDQRFEAFLEK